MRSHIDGRDIRENGQKDEKEREIEELYGAVEREQNEVPDYTKHIGVLIFIMALWGVFLFYPRWDVMLDLGNMLYLFLAFIASVLSILKRKHVFVLIMIGLEIIAFLEIVGSALSHIFLPWTCKDCAYFAWVTLIAYSPALLLSLLTLYLYFETKDIFED
jgi:hypothetical protein